MTCFSAKRKTSAYVDGRLRPAERAQLTAHYEECQTCSAYLHEVRSLVSGLHQLEPPGLPLLLSTRLRVIASRECASVLNSQGSRLMHAWNRWKLELDELMRALTIPATGGLISSIILFACLAVSITQTARGVAYEVPVMMEDHTDANLIPVDMRSSVVLTISLDDKGHIQDYSIRDGANSYMGNTARLASNSISLPQFPTVLTMAQPITGDIRISLTPVVFRP